ncbi:MAG TPA: sugar isomerase [bacterium]|nr:sugar isomerase [bacterium]
MALKTVHPCRQHCLCVPHPEHSCTSVTRREFIAGMGTLALGGCALSTLRAGEKLVTPNSRQVHPMIATLKVRPVLVFEIPQRREAVSWRSWGGIQTREHVVQEKERISKELVRLLACAEFPIELLNLEEVETPEQAARVASGDHDVLLIYAAGNHAGVLDALVRRDKWNLMYLRHNTGPVYLWYEVAHPIFLRKTVDQFAQTGLQTRDVVVDDYTEILWRLRSLHGLKKSLGRRIVAIGGSGGWGAGGAEAPNLAREVWQMDIQDVSYEQLGKSIAKGRSNAALVASCQREAKDYLSQRGVTLRTSLDAVVNAFVLKEVFLDILEEYQCDAITVQWCMGTIMPLAETTACLPLSLLNDEGYLAFCESDFVVIPSGILLQGICGMPVFLNDPTYPHDNQITLAHCTAPRKMNGRKVERAIILTHFESDYGAAPKVEMKIGQKVTNLIPDFSARNWVGCSGTILANPFLDICRSQIDVKLDGNCDELVAEMKGFHWMTSYGNYLKEIGYALEKVGVKWNNISGEESAS